MRAVALSMTSRVRKDRLEPLFFMILCDAMEARDPSIHYPWTYEVIMANINNISGIYRRRIGLQLPATF
jgi:hypothetical protein